MSTISLCIPAYNAAWCLPRLLKSAQNQIVPFDEILVYDDCSNDDTVEIAKKYGAKVIVGDVNAGCSTGKNVLAKAAKSEWLHFHDADDDLLPNFTSVAHSWIKSERVPDIVLMHYHYIDSNDGKMLGEPCYSLIELSDDPVAFTISNKIVNFALVNKNSFIRIGGFDTDPLVLYNEDKAFYTRASIYGLTFGYEKKVTCINFFYNKSMSASNKAKCAQAQYHVLKKVTDAVGDKYNKNIAEQCLISATYAATANDWKTVSKLIKLAKQLAPKQIPKGSNHFCFLFKVNPFCSYIIRELIIKYLTTKRKTRVRK